MMMRFIAFLALVASSQAFAPMTIQSRSTKLFSSDSHIDKSYTAGSGMDIDTLPFMISHLNEDNFVESLEMMEPLLMNECVGEECDILLEHIRNKAEDLGMEVPEGYAPNHH